MALPAPEMTSPTSLPLPDPMAYEGEPREYARALMERKDQIDAELTTSCQSRLDGSLRAQGVSVSTPLIDPEGYPRGDIDVYSIRHIRAALVRLRNDRQQVENLLSAALQDAFARPSGSNPPSSSSSKAPAMTNGHDPSVKLNGNHEDMPDEWPEKPVALVNSVSPASPAAQADLKAGDKIYSFGGITHVSAGGLQAIGALVVQSHETALTLLVSRGDPEQRLRLRLTPRTGWGGRGSLGCHILPAT